MSNDKSGDARELLAREYEARGLPTHAAAVREGRDLRHEGLSDITAAVVAIEAALSRQDRPVEPWTREELARAIYQEVEAQRTDADDALPMDYGIIADPRQVPRQPLSPGWMGAGAERADRENDRGARVLPLHQRVDHGARRAQLLLAPAEQGR